MKLLLHCCCAPCSGAVIERLLQEGIRPALFFSNSNITPRAEYDKRKAELLRYASALKLEVIDDDYDHGCWLSSIKGLENEPERGLRCECCFAFRLGRAARYAAANGFDTLATTLASSRWKDLEQVDRAGRKACGSVSGVQWWGRNWRKGGLQQRRGEIIREWNFYEQDWCGCEFSHRGPRIMGILNLTPDSFWEPSRCKPADALERMRQMVSEGASIIDLGAVSTRPGAAPVSEAEEWARLEPVMTSLGPDLAALDVAGKPQISIDTTRASIVRRCFDAIGSFIVNDISAGENDPLMLETVAGLGLPYIAMHKRGDPATMDSLTDYPEGITCAVKKYFSAFAAKAASYGIRSWILDPGFGFAKTEQQNHELLDNLKEFKCFGRPILAGIADKRFTRGRTQELQALALRNGASILRVHDVAAAVGLLQ